MTDVLQRLTRGLSGTYTIERELGAGGMATVYLARDEKHDREVAIKVVQPEISASLGDERFLREIRITAKLSHPNILPLYDSGEAEGLLYYVMPYVPGESVGQRLHREEQLSIPEAVQIAREVGEALSYAHSYGLIHRDIKPDNILLSRGHAVVADFGVARAISTAGSDTLTQTGTAIGTAAYMAPEQAAGNPNIDGRADVYALGCVLYEMLVGQVPFTGPSPQAVMARHTMDAVPPPSIMRQSISPDLEAIIFCAMAKTPADRFRTAQEFVDAINAFASGAAPVARLSGMQQQHLSQVDAQRLSMGMAHLSGVQPAAAPSKAKRALLLAGLAVAALAAGLGGWQLLKSDTPAALGTGGLDPRDVAVLYFDDLSPDNSLAFAADGITEELIGRLARVQGLQVISRNGVTPFRDQGIPHDSIGRSLNVGTIVVGAVEPAGDDIRVSTRLVDGASGADLGGAARGSFQVPADNVLAARDSVVANVAEFLRQRIGEQVRVRDLRAGTGSVEAWSLLQRGVRARREAEDAEQQVREASLAHADSLLGLAEQADPTWPEPKLERGWVAYSRGDLAEGRAAVPYFEEAVRLADEVLAAEPSDARALELRGTARFIHYTRNVTDNPTAWDRMLTSAQEDLEGATAIDPSLATAHLTLSRLYYWVDNVGSALIAAQRAYEADAYLEQIDDTIDRLFWGNIDQEQFGQADTWCARGAGRFPDDFRFKSCRLFLMVTPPIAPDVDLAWRLVAELDTIDAPAFVRAQARFLTGGVVAKAQFTDSARRVLDRTRDGVTGEIDPGQNLAAIEAYVRTLAGDQDEAIELLKRAVAANPDHDFAGTAGQTWWWRELRQNPRWREISGGR